jgi:hypothetical protein
MRRLILLLVVAGCGGSGGEGATPDACGPRTGLYRAVYATRSGDCGALGENVASLDGAALPAGCVTKYPVDLTSCRVMFDVTCPVEGKASTTSRIAGVTMWQPGGTVGSSLMSAEIRSSGALQCQGTYDVTYTKI